MKKRLFSLFAAALMFTMLFAVSQTIANAADDPFTAVRLRADMSVVIDGDKDAVWDDAAAIPIETVVRNGGHSTASVKFMWDTDYFYVFAEVTDNTPYAYETGTWLELRDAFELRVDLLRNAEHANWGTIGWGGAYRGDEMVEGGYKMAAGWGKIGKGTGVNAGAAMQANWEWLSNAKQNEGTYASTYIKDAQDHTIGYTMEWKIDMGDHKAKYMLQGHKIGVGIKIYDKFQTGGDGQIIVMEQKNNGMGDGPRNLSEVTLVANPNAGREDNIPKFKAPAQRKNAFLDAYRGITIDGVRDEIYKDGDNIDISVAVGTTTAQMNARFLHTVEGVYMSADVSDGSNNGADDTVTLYLDALNDDKTDSAEWDSDSDLMGKFIFSRNDTKSGDWGYYSDTAADIRFKTTSIASGYKVEAFIPYPVDYEYAVDNRLGFALVVSDNGEKVYRNEASAGCDTQRGLLCDLVLAANNADFPNARNRYQAVRARSGLSIDIDGEMDEAYLDATEIAIKTPISGTTSVTAKAYIVWTNFNLYVFVDVADANPSEYDTGDRWMSDSVELMLDTWNNDPLREQKMGDGYRGSRMCEGQFRINAGDSNIRSGFHYLYDALIGMYEGYSSIGQAGYTAEFKIPYGKDGAAWHFGKEETKVGHVMNIAICVNDGAKGTRAGAVATNTLMDAAFDTVGVYDKITLSANGDDTPEDFDDPKVIEPQAIPVDSVTLNKTAASMKVNDSLILTATAIPDGAEDIGMIWSSSDTSIATVDAGGKIIALKAGTVTITATARDGGGAYADCVITVTAAKKGGCNGKASVASIVMVLGLFVLTIAKRKV
jgi:hypothetical protein